MVSIEKCLLCQLEIFSFTSLCGITLIIIAIVGHHQVSSWRDFMKTGKKVRIYTDFAEPRRETVSTIFFKQAIKTRGETLFPFNLFAGQKGRDSTT